MNTIDFDCKFYAFTTRYTTRQSSTVLTTVLCDPFCCDYTMKVRAPNAVRRSGAPHMYWPHKSKTFVMETPFLQLN
jgi:hypothetical protein